MIKKGFLFFVLMLFANISFSQDIVRFLDGTEKKMKVINSDHYVIVLKNLETQQNDTIEKSKIQEIVFVNGEVLKLNKAKNLKNQDVLLSKEPDNNNIKSDEHELKNIAMSTELISLISDKTLFFDIEFFQKKTSLNLCFGKNLEKSDLFLGGDFRIYFNNPAPQKFYFGDKSLGAGFVKFFASPGIIVNLSKSDSASSSVSIPVSLGLSFTLTSGLYLALWAGPSYEVSSSIILANFRFSTGYRFNQKN